jgi:Family of unknown function (DUF6236)
MNAPRGAWFAHALLYWDEVGLLLPENPRRLTTLENRTLELIHAGLVKPIPARDYIGLFPNFDGAFLELVAGRAQALHGRRVRVANVIHLHESKMRSGLVRDLETLGLARPADPVGSWYEIEENTAKLYLCYLATVFAQSPSFHMRPITDEAAALRAFSTEGFEDLQTNLALDLSRTSVLRSILPVPDDTLPIKAIVDFKEAHAAELRRFRRLVESRLIELAQISPELRDQRVRYFADDLVDQRDAIIDLYLEAGWRRPRFATICTIVGGAIGLVTGLETVGTPGAVAALPPLLAAAYAAIGEARPHTPDLSRDPLAYAVSFRRALPPPRGAA